MQIHIYIHIPLKTVARLRHGPPPRPLPLAVCPGCPSSAHTVSPGLILYSAYSPGIPSTEPTEIHTCAPLTETQTVLWHRHSDGPARHTGPAWEGGPTAAREYDGVTRSNEKAPPLPPQWRMALTTLRRRTTAVCKRTSDTGRAVFNKC